MSKLEITTKLFFTPLVLLAWIGYRLKNQWLINPKTLAEYWREF